MAKQRVARVTTMAGLRSVSAVLLIFTMSVQAAEEQDPRLGKELAQSSLEELMNIEVSSVSRRAQSLAHTAAAVYVITRDDIRRSGATSIPEALRMAPGLDVAQIDASKWAISARGNNARFANKLLVLIDGRSVYTNLYAGVYWDQNDVLLENVERIEVIRGPGATMWGANAVNGVINIITKHTNATKGTLVSAGTASDAPATVAMQYGAQANSKLTYRLFAKYNRFRDSLTAQGLGAGDQWSSVRGGARVDWNVSEKDSLTIHGDSYHGDAGQRLLLSYPVPVGPVLRTPLNFGGGYGLIRWAHTSSKTSESVLQAYINRENRYEYLGLGKFQAFDLDFQNQRRLGGRNDLIWGLGYRLLSDRIDGQHGAGFIPPRRSDNLYSSFVQDELALVEGKLALTVGSKFQHNNYTGFEIQPSARLLWTPNRQESIWLAGSRAVRTPSRFDSDLNLEFALPPQQGLRTVGRLIGNPNFQAETLRGVEAGYRRQIGDKIAVDLASFLSFYGNRRRTQQLSPYVDFSAGPRLIVPFAPGNSGFMKTAGMETAVTYSVRSNWKLMGSHSWLYAYLPQSAAPALSFEPAAKTSPAHQWQVRSNLDLTRRWSTDVFAYRVGTLSGSNVPSYFRVDARIGYKLSEYLELSIGARNLLDERHQEFAAEDHVRNAYLRRAAWVRLTWAF